MKPHTHTHTHTHTHSIYKPKVRCFLIFQSVLLILVLNTAVVQKVNAQDYCQSGANEKSIGLLPGTASAMSGPIYLKLYVYTIDKSGGNERPTVANVEESVSILRQYFSSADIHFVWDCYINPITSTTLYNATGTPCELETYANETDGINLFIGPDNAGLQNNASVPSRHVIVKGTRGCTGISGSSYVTSRSTVIAHEMGHALGLWHTYHGTYFEGGSCGSDGDPDECAELVNGSNDDECGDYVEDTEADPRILECQSTVVSGCNFVTTAVDINNDVYDPDETLIMSNAHPNCHQRFSDGQIERMRRMIAYAEVLEDCIIEPDMTNVTINSNTTWTTGNTPNGGDFWLEDDLIIEPGYTLDINAGVTVHFGEESRVIVKPNATLILRGTLTGLGCSGLTWQGVKVWGSTSAYSQFPVSGVRAQGRMLTYGGVIERAGTAIQLYGPTYTLAGGQLSASDLTIRNCSIGVDVAPFHNFWPGAGASQNQPRPYACSIRGCEFIVDDDYAIESPFEAFINLEGVNGVSITGSVFTNEMLFIDATSIADWGYGIKASDAGFVLGPTCSDAPPPDQAPCVSYVESEFHNLGYGIYTARLLDGKPFQVRQATFNGCYVALAVKGVSGGTILFNEFNLGEIPDEELFEQQIGIHFEGEITGFECQENSFVNITDTDDFATIGIVTENTGDDQKEIRRNEFEDLHTGNCAIGFNGTVDPDAFSIQGLVYLCNENYGVDGDGFDFNVSSGMIEPNQMVIVDLDPIEVQATGNQFSYTATDFRNAGTVDIYYYCFDEGNQPLVVAEGLVEAALLNGEEEENPCPSNYCIPPCLTSTGIGNLKTDFNDAKSEFISAKSAYQISPSAALLREVLFHKSLMYQTGYQISLHAAYDTLTFKLDTLTRWLTNVKSYSGDLWLSGVYLAQKDTVKSKQVLDSMAVRFVLTTEQENEIDDAKILTELLYGKNVYALDSITLDQIAAFDSVSGFAGVMARNILTLYGQSFDPSQVCSEDVEVFAHARSSDNPRGGLNAHGMAGKEFGLDSVSRYETQPVQIIVFPNPGSEKITFNMVGLAQESLLRVFNGDGKLVFEQSVLGSEVIEWNASEFPNGIYFYSLSGIVGNNGKLALLR